MAVKPSLMASALLLLCFASSVLNDHVIGEKAKMAGYTNRNAEIHDIAVTSVRPSKAVVGEGYCTSINAVVENQGSLAENFRIAAYADATIISQATLTLASNRSAAISLTWNTTGFALGNYTISASATPVSGETDTADNDQSGGWVIVTVVGDVTGPRSWPDYEVDKQDLVLVISKFGSSHVGLGYDPNCDINNDGKIDMRDVALTAKMRAQASRKIDVWMTDPPSGGQGTHEPADLVLPQTEISLAALVTYDERPAQYKNVTFEIRYENGRLWKEIEDVSDEYGYAYATFRMPWPRIGVEDVIGIWNITVSVTLADVVTTDWVVFDYGYLVRIVNVTTDEAEYAHCEDVEVTVKYETSAVREEDVVLAVTMTDELGVPIAVSLVELTVGGAEFFQYKSYTTRIELHVDKFACAGLAAAHLTFLSALPQEGGVAVARESTATFYILPM